MTPHEIDKLLWELRELAALDDPAFSARTQSQRICLQAAAAIEELLGKTRDTDTLTVRQREALEAAHKASDSWICRGSSRIWVIAPKAVHACVKKGLLQMPRRRGRARLTPAVRALLEGSKR